MSCLEKLKNIPGVSAVDQALKGITPSALQGKSLSQRVADVGNSLNSVKDNIKQQVTAAVDNAINAVTGQIGATVNQIKGIANNLKNLGRSFINAFEKTAQVLAKTAKAVYEAIECETTAIKDGITQAYETSLLQTDIQQAAGNVQLSNNLAKQASENIETRTALINAQTEATLAVTATAAVATPSNKQINEKQVKTVDKMQTLSTQIDYDIVYERPVRDLTQLSRLQLLDILRERLSGVMNYYSNSKYPQIKAARLAEQIRIENDIKNDSTPKFLYIENEKYIIKR
jgi:hypothetical protein